MGDSGSLTCWISFLTVRSTIRTGMKRKTRHEIDFLAVVMTISFSCMRRPESTESRNMATIIHIIGGRDMQTADNSSYRLKLFHRLSLLSL